MLEERYSNELVDILQKLQNITTKLRIIGITIFLITVFALALAIGSLTNRYMYHDFLYFVIILVILSLSLLVVYDYQRRRGDVLFEEVSDELQWNLTKTLKEQTDSPRPNRPDLLARIVLRQYNTSIDLPLARGKNGIMIYVLVNVSTLIIISLAIQIINMQRY
jgi:hypothetical protein